MCALNENKAQTFCAFIALMLQDRSLLYIDSMTSLTMKGMNESDDLACSLMGTIWEQVENLTHNVG